jgi:hypothetical protein
LINDESLTPPKINLPRFLMVENAANVGKKWVYTEGSSFILSANPNASKATGNGAKWERQWQNALCLWCKYCSFHY